jgi:hypothetical protein
VSCDLNAAVNSHRKSYFDDGNAKFWVYHASSFIATPFPLERNAQIQSTLYNLYGSIFFRHSFFFRDLLAAAPPATDLLKGWETHATPAGKRFFVNHALGRITFAPPRITELVRGTIVLSDVAPQESDALPSLLHPGGPTHEMCAPHV